MFGGHHNALGGFGMYGNNNPFGGGMGELASDWAINRFVPGGLNSKFTNIRSFFFLFRRNIFLLRSNGYDC
jgi:hypothetical protein